MSAGSNGSANMAYDIVSIYAAALRAADECIAEPRLRKEIEDLARSVAAMAMAEWQGTFIGTALTLKPRVQGLLSWQLNKLLVDPDLRRRIADLIAQRSQDIAMLPAAAPSSAGARFTQDGIVAFQDLVSAREAEEMLTYLRNCPNTTRQDSVLHHNIHDIVRAPHAFRIATDERVLSIAHQYLGAPPVIVQMDAWWSLPEREEPHGAQIFHRDRDDFRACKLFVYLSDVNAGDGPHIFVRGSHRVDAVQDTLAAKGMPLESVSAFFEGNGRQVADKIDDIFGAAVEELTGPAGTCFLENTYGYHRGKIPKTGRRCLFQVLYAVIPYPDRLERWAAAELNALPADCAGDARARHAARFAVS